MVPFRGLIPAATLSLPPRCDTLVQAPSLENGQSIRKPPRVQNRPASPAPTRRLGPAGPLWMPRRYHPPDPVSPVPRAWQPWPRLHMAEYSRGGTRGEWGHRPCQLLQPQLLGTIQMVALGTIIQCRGGVGNANDQKVKKVDQLPPLAKTRNTACNLFFLEIQRVGTLIARTWEINL